MLHQAQLEPFEATRVLIRKQAAQDSRTWAAIASSLMLLASMLFILGISASATADTVESVSESELATQKLAGGDLCESGVHQSPIDLPDSGTRLDELPFFGWSDDHSPADAEELFEGNTFQVCSCLFHIFHVSFRISDQAYQ